MTHSERRRAISSASERPPGGAGSATLTIGGSTLHACGTVRGLASEAREVERVYRRARPEALCLSLSEEDLRMLTGSAAGPAGQFEPTPLEEVYIGFLENFGKVRLPPPSFTAALRLARADSIPVLPMDLSDARHTEVFTKEVGTMEWIYHYSFRRKSLLRRRWKAATPGEFAIEWDEALTRGRGLRRVEEARESHMAGELRAALKRWSRVMAVVDFERMRGVLKRLETA